MQSASNAGAASSGQDFLFDAFISYSRADKSFAEHLEQALEEYVPPKDLEVPQRRLQIFRDEADLTGAEYYQAIDRNLNRSRKLIVVCSPRARTSAYVNDEIERFVKTRGAANVIPVLIDGIPNNKAARGQEDFMAFPDALCAALAMPLATSFLGFDSQKDHAGKGSFEPSWYTLLANLYEVSRGEIEQRDLHKRRQDRITISYQLAAAARNALDTDAELAALLGLHAVWTTYGPDRSVTPAAEEILYFALHSAQQRRCTPELVLSGHQLGIWDVKYSPSGDRLVTSSEDGTWRVWDAASGEPLYNNVGFVGFQYSGGVTAIKSIALSPDGSAILTSHYDGTARLWNTTSGSPIGELLGHADRLWNVALSPDGRYAATASFDGHARIWDVESGECTQILPLGLDAMFWGRILPVLSVEFSPDGKRLAVGVDFGITAIVDVESGAILARPEGHEEAINDIAYSPDGKLLATASEDGTWRLWDAESGKPVRTVKTAPSGEVASGVKAIAFSPDGRLLATAHSRRFVENRDAPTHKTVGVWEVESGRKITTLAGHGGGVWSVAFSPHGEKLASASYDATVRIWDMVSRDLGVSRWAGHEGGVLGVTFCGNDSLASMGRDRTIRIWDVASGRERFRIPLPADGEICGLVCNNEARTIAAGHDTAVILYDCGTGKETGRIAVDAGVKALAYSPDGRRIVIGCQDGSARICAVAGQELLKLAGAHDQIVSVAYTPDGARIVTAGSAHPYAAVAPANTDAVVWDAETGKSLLRLSGHRQALMSVAAAETVFVTGSQDNIARVWDGRSGAELAALTGHTRTIGAVSISPDGTRVASASEDYTVKLWRWRQSEEPITLRAHTNQVAAVAFSPDGARVASAGIDGYILLHTIDPPWLVSVARAGLRRKFTMQESRRYFNSDTPPPLEGQLAATV